MNIEPSAKQSRNGSSHFEILRKPKNIMLIFGLGVSMR
jgi:hypothetical protein